MKINSQYHLHSSYSKDAKGTIEEIVIEAIRLGYYEVGISDHGPGHKKYGITLNELKEARIEVDKLNKKYNNINILLGIEANIINENGDLCIDDEAIKLLDYINAGYHYASKSNNAISDFKMHIKNLLNIKTKNWKNHNTKMFINAIKKNNIKMITHPCSKCIIDVIEVAKVAKEYGTLIEINLFHNNISKHDLINLSKMGVNFCISSDAHKIDQIKMANKVLDRVVECNIDIELIANVEE